MRLQSIELADSPESWRALGFHVNNSGVCNLGTVHIRLTSATSGTPAGARSYTVEVANGSSAASSVINGVLMTVRPQTDASHASLPCEAHPQTAIGMMKAVIRAVNTTSTASALESFGLGKPALDFMANTPLAVSGKAHVALYLMDNLEYFEVVDGLLPDSATKDILASFFVVVKDMNAAVANIPKDYLIPQDEYPVGSGRRRIQVDASKAGLSCNIHFIDPPKTTSKLPGAQPFPEWWSLLSTVGTFTKSAFDLGMVTMNGDAMLHFYRDILGLQYEGQRPMPGLGVMHRVWANDSLLKIVSVTETTIAAANPPGGINGGTGMRYLTFSVPSVKDNLEACRLAGRNIVLEYREIEAPLVGRVAIGMVEDPDGNWVEFKEDLPVIAKL